MIQYKDKELWTYFFSKPRTYYNKYMFEMVKYDKYILFDKEYIESLKNKWASIFKNDKPIFLEIGSGSGNFATQYCKINNDINYLAIELRLKRLVVSSQKTINNNLENLKFIKYNAHNIDNIFSENEISGVIINFPDPWEQNPKKRILSDNLLDKLNTILKNNSKIYFKTDHYGYYTDTINLINSRSDFKITAYTDDLHNSVYNENNIQTEFEQLFINKHKMKINYIEIMKVSK